MYGTIGKLKTGAVRHTYVFCFLARVNRIAIPATVSDCITERFRVVIVLGVNCGNFISIKSAVRSKSVIEARIAFAGAAA